MQYLYAAKRDGEFKLVATFDSEQQLRAYVNWATLQSTGERQGKFEQGSALASFNAWKESSAPLSPDEDAAAVPHNPTPSML
ncbi:MAG TPA: hypothetical protein VF175_18430 [Lacipirellula sp.]